MPQFRNPRFSRQTAPLHRPGPASSVWRGILRTSRHLRKRKAPGAQLQLVSTDGENFRRGCAGMSALRRPDAYSGRYRRSLRRSQDSRLSRPALTATPGCSRSPEPTPRNRPMVMAKRATFAEVCLRHLQCFVRVRQSCVFKFWCARKTPARTGRCNPDAWNRVFHHSRPHNSWIGSG
jgi:hypothetical protein